MPKTSISSKQDRKDSPLVVDTEHRQDWRSFMGDQIDLSESDERWKGMCESLQRQAHGFPARFASAYAHQVATPKSERIDPKDAPVGAFIFVDDPADSNRFGHIVGKWTKTQPDGSMQVVTNDVNDSETGYDPGNVTVCPLHWFPRFWGDAIQFATLWFGADEIPTKEPATPRKPARVGTAAEVKQAIANAEEVIEWMRQALRDNNGREHPNHERALKREIKDQQQIIRSLRRLLPGG